MLINASTFLNWLTPSLKTGACARSWSLKFEHLCEIYESLREDVKEKLKSYVHDPDKVCVMC